MWYLPVCIYSLINAQPTKKRLSSKTPQEEDQSFHPIPKKKPKKPSNLCK